MRGLARIALWGAAALAVSPAMVPADEPPALPPDLVRALDADPLAERERATSMIVSGGEPMARLAAVEATLRDAGLSREQRERLHTAGLRLFSATPRAAMGVTIKPFYDEGPVTVDPSAPGFDAARVLQEGDVVRSADGLPILSDVDLRCAIVSHDPGDEMTLGIVRSGEPMVVKVRLGRYSDLRQDRPVDDHVLAGAWERRAARSSPPSSPPLAGPLSAERWAAAVERARDRGAQRSEPAVDPTSHEPVRSPVPRPPGATLTIGGQASDPALRQTSVAAAGRRYAPSVEAQLLEQRRNAAATLNIINYQLTQATDRIAEIERFLANPEATAEQRAAGTQELEALRIRRSRLAEQAELISDRLGR